MFQTLNVISIRFQSPTKYADKKFKVGESNKLEKINASLQRHDLKLQLQQANTQMAVYYSELQKWIYSRDSYQAPENYTSLPPINLSDTALIKNHPVLQYLQQQVVAKELAINAEKAKKQPSFNLGVNAQSLDKQQPFFYGSVGINIPLFKTGVKARMQSAKIETAITKREVEKSQQDLTTIYQQQYELQQQYIQQLNYYQTDGLPTAESIISTAQKSYKAGDIGYIEYIQNLKDAVKIKEDYLTTINNYNQVVIAIQYLLNK
jgi:cobalt-zinc-cadmium resistance protein CzcA